MLSLLGTAYLRSFRNEETSLKLATSIKRASESDVFSLQLTFLVTQFLDLLDSWNASISNSPTNFITIRILHWSEALVFHVEQAAHHPESAID